jgi:hypothetical protein
MCWKQERTECSALSNDVAHKVRTSSSTIHNVRKMKITTLNRILVFCCCLIDIGLAACEASEIAGTKPAAGQAAMGRNWSLKLPKIDKVVFSGALDYDGASVDTNSMLYPAPNAAAFLVSVVTHGLIVESQKDNQRKKAQEQADEVLEPYRLILDTFTFSQLAQPWLDGSLPATGRKLVVDGESPEGGDWSIESVPVFLMAQNQKALILDNLVSIRAPNANEDTLQQTRIRVISHAEENPDPAAIWTADQGRKLKEVSAWLFSESMNIALNDASHNAGNHDHPFKTIRYLEGGTNKMERAQVIDDRCDRLVIRTLRGSFMSVPVKPSLSGKGSSPETRCLKE